MATEKEEEWKEAGNTQHDETWDRSSILRGTYTEKQEGVGPNESMLYTVVTEEGKLIGVWGSTVIDTKMKTIPLGSEVKLESLGEVKGKNGKAYMDFKILYRPAPMVEATGKEDNDEEINPDEIPF